MDIYKQYFNAETFHDDDKRKLGRELLKSICKIAPDSITMFPMFGTLLGIVRDKDIIKHDVDIDLGFIDDKNVMNEFLHSIDGKDGWKLVRNSANFLYSACKENIMFDFYRYVDTGNRLDCMINSTYFLTYEEVFPMKTIEFDSTVYNCIANPVDFFERYYGSDWQTPK